MSKLAPRSHSSSRNHSTRSGTAAQLQCAAVAGSASRSNRPRLKPTPREENSLPLCFVTRHLTSESFRLVTGVRTLGPTTCSAGSCSFLSGGGLFFLLAGGHGHGGVDQFALVLPWASSAGSDMSGFWEAAAAAGSPAATPRGFGLGRPRPSR